MKLYDRPHIFRSGGLGLLLALATCVPFALAQSRPSYEALIQQGKAELQSGNNDQALATGEQAIKLDPSRWEAYALAGGALMNLKHYARAATNFNEAAKRAPQAKQAALLNLRRQALLDAAGVTQPSAATPATSRQAPPAPAPVTQAEIVLWESIKNSTNPADFQTYLQQYPNGAFAALAKRNLAAIETQAEKVQKQQQALTELRKRVCGAQLLRTLEGHRGAVYSVAISPDDRILASGSADKTIKLWDVASGQLLRTLEGHRGWVESVAFSPDGRILASGSRDKTVILWDVATGQPMRTLEGHRGWVTSVAFSPDGRLLASGSSDTTVKLWDVASGRLLRTLATIVGTTTGWWPYTVSVAFSPDGRLLASGSSYENGIGLWNVASGQLVRTPGDHKGVSVVAFSPDGRILASGNSDGYVNTIGLFDVVAGQRLCALQGHGDWVTAVAFSRDGRLLASSSADKTIKLWDLSGQSR